MADTSGTYTGAEVGAQNNKKPMVARKDKTSRSSFGYILSTVARIFTWYSIFVVLFQCPSTLEECTDSTPWACKPYFQIKKAVTPHALRHYDNYAAPSVQIVKPYYDTIDRAIVSPTWTYTVKYGAPQLYKAQAFSQAQWTSSIQPQLAKVQKTASKQYNQVLGPYVDRATMALTPYYEIGRNSAFQTHHDVILPAYKFLSPYALQGYSVAADFTTGTAVPAVVWTYDRTSNFVYLAVMPQLRALYVEMIEPQLVKVGLNPGFFGDESQPSTSQRTVHNNGPSSFVKPAQASTPVTSVASVKLSSSTAGASGSDANKATTVAPTTASSEVAMTGSADASQLEQQEAKMQDRADPKEEEAWRNARETVAEDLRAWQEKYTKAADEGAAEIDKSVEEISKRMIGRNARTAGRALINDLQKSVAAGLAQLRRDVVAIVNTVVKESTTAEDANKEVLVAMRRAGVNIKDKAQAVRLWREEYDKELHDTVNRAAENHFQILGSIRDLALQRIGMKWAWMEGVTYKDWAKYHQLKGRFEELENDLEQLIVTHPGIEAATTAAQAVENEAMSLAQSAVKELARLKQVAELKITELDTSDEFDVDTIKANVAAAKAAAKEAAEAEARAAKEAEEAAAAEAQAQAALEAERLAGETIEETTETEAQPLEDATNDTVETFVADTATGTEDNSGTAAADTGKGVQGTATIAPDEVPIVLGETYGSIAQDTLTTDIDDATEGSDVADAAESTDAPVHLPVDEVIAAEQVPLAVASSVDAEATIVELAKKAGKGAAEEIEDEAPAADKMT
ncbi:hypothetical protein SEPCBS57363_003343 [Sporothrix epigloea]|uniref:Transcription factor hoxa13 n=1 Tax=Sporothrix epigloea TaxID=1892477 RepID=A0ABP0DKY0_9PEZI